MGSLVTVSFLPLETMSTCKIRPTSKGSEAYIDWLAPDDKNNMRWVKTLEEKLVVGS